MFSLPLSVWPGGVSPDGRLKAYYRLAFLLLTQETYGTQADLFALLYAGKTTVRFHLLEAAAVRSTLKVVPFSSDDNR